MEPLVELQAREPVILDMIMTRQLKLAPFAEPIIALEITQGPFKGIVFSFKTFEVMPVVLENGMAPTRYETQIHLLPDHFGRDWQPNEAFDRFTSEVLFAWLMYVHTNNLAPLLKSRPAGTGVQ